MAEHVEGPGMSQNKNDLIHFTCPVGEPMPRVFRAYFDLDDPSNDVLYTDIEGEDNRGGMENQSELVITQGSTDPKSIKYWQMTAAHRQQYRAQLASDMGLDEITEALKRGDGTEEVITDSVPVHEQGIKSIEYQNTQQIQQQPQPQPQQVFSQYDVQCEVLINIYRAALDDLMTYCQLENIDAETRMSLAQQKMISVEKTEEEYGIRETSSSDSNGL